MNLARSNSLQDITAGAADMNIGLDIARMKVRERQLRAEIKDNLKLYNLDDLDTFDEVSEGLQHVSELGRAFSNLHVELEVGVGETEYQILFPKARDFKGKILEYQIKAKALGKRLRTDESREQQAQIARDKREEEDNIKRTSLRVEIKVFSEKLNSDISNFRFSTINECKSSIRRFEGLLDECYGLISQTRVLFAADFNDQFGGIFDNVLASIRGQIETGKDALSKLTIQEKLDSNRARAVDEKLSNDKFLKDQRSFAKILVNEIELRSETMMNKCDSTALAGCNDYELLDRGKKLDDIDQEMREIFSKFSEVSKIVVSIGEDAKPLYAMAKDLQDSALKARNTYAIELHSLLTTRDVTEEKLKSKEMNFELETFSGYDSKIDIYDFRAQFEKLIQPSKQRMYWVDILKNKYLSGAALTLVEQTKDIDEVWNKLIGAYGNMKLLLQNKVSDLQNLDNLDSLHDDENLGTALAKIINAMTELTNLAKRYNLEYKLYVGGGLEKVISLVGSDRERRFVKWSLERSNPMKFSSSQSEICAEQTEWENLKDFLLKEHAVRERMTLLNKSKEALGLPSSSLARPSYPASVGLPCPICEKTGHVVSHDSKGKACIDYYSCPDFVNMSPYQRCSTLLRKKLCVQCLVSGMKHDEQHKCYDAYVCPDPSHGTFPKGLHVLLCDKHKKNAANIALLDKFKRKVISRRSKQFADFTKNISLVSISQTFHSYIGGIGFPNVTPDVRYSAIFMFQTIVVEGVHIRLFFDSGAGDLVVKKSAMDALVKLGRARQEVPGPISISGVGDHQSVTQHGIFSVVLPLKDGQNVVFSGVCLDRVTTVFPSYELRNVESDIRSQVKSEGGDPHSLPKLSKIVGGETDIIIGAKYFYAHPREIWRSKTGLAIFDSSFASVDGSTGVVIGPHKKFSETEQNFRQANPTYSNTNSYFYTSAVLEYRKMYHDLTNATALGNMPDSDNGLCEFEHSNIVSHVSKRTPRCVVTFDEIDTAGTDASFRCVDCRSCEKCKKSKRVDAISMHEEIEQAIIERNVTVDPVARRTSHLLPFVTDPDSRIDPMSQEKLSLQVYRGTVKRLHDKPLERDTIIKSERKLHDLGYVDWVDNLPADIQNMIRSKVRYIIPWRVVYNANSVSTPCRLVFDASASARGKCSLNSLLAKGTNNLNNMVMIMIRWMCYIYAFHTDISKMYNTIWLDSKHWRYQLYFWNDELKLGVEPRLKAIMTAIYGVTPSGNVADCGIKKTAEIAKPQYPNAYDLMMRSIYVDDTMGGAHRFAERLKLMEEFSGALALGGFNLKGYTLSGMDPPENLANDDGVSVNVGGLKWFPKNDELSIKIPELNFGRKKRGKKCTDGTAGVIPDNLTLRNCLSVVYEIFDPVGKVAPLVCGFKIDIRELHLRKLSWDDVLPENLRQVWTSNIEMIQEIRNIRYNRAVIPPDAVDLKCETIDTADASLAMICIAIYVRFRLRNGGFSCQLIFARTKTVPADMTQPRSEMLAASLNASTGHVVKTALGDHHVKCLKLTDSQVSLFWISSVRSKLKMWVRGHSIHINRLASRELWRYVKSRDMIADIGTRKGAKIEDVGPDSQWVNGFEWMRGPESDFPMTSATDIILSSERKREALKECISVEVAHHTQTCQSAICTSYTPVVPKAVGERYKYSKYVIDPNRFRFRKVARVLGLVLHFIRLLRERVGKPAFPVTVCNAKDLPGGVIIRSEEKELLVTGGSDADPRYRCAKGLVVKYPDHMINAAMQYFFKKATQEVKHFLPESKYKHISEEKSDILYYTGRILPTQEIGLNDCPTMCDACLDLMKSTFCVPLVDVMSPLAYSLTDEIHWYHPDVMHGGVESLLRETNRVAFIIGGRNLVKTMKENCARCRYLHRHEVKVAMGPKHESNLCIAPAFFNTQVDLCGPFESFSNVNKRAKVKIYLVIFCCATTGATDIKVMDDYSTDSFILAFIRFSCRYGYPSSLYPDPGSQLIKGCNDMIISFSTIKYRLEVEYGVEFHTCPVGSHYVHGKVERKIREVRSSINKHVQKQRLSILQWETLGQQISNSINNLPIGVGSKTQSLENLDLITPNRLLLGRNNNRCPTAPLILSDDHKQIIKSNENIFRAWFRGWLVSHVPTLIPQPKWHTTNRQIAVGDVVLFSKSDKEFENLYQFGIVTAVRATRDGLVRTVDVEYQNSTERTKRSTTRGARELVVIHRVDELGISKELHDLAVE